MRGGGCPGTPVLPCPARRSSSWERRPEESWQPPFCSSPSPRRDGPAAPLLWHLRVVCPRRWRGNGPCPPRRPQIVFPLLPGLPRDRPLCRSAGCLQALVVFSFGSLEKELSARLRESGETLTERPPCDSPREGLPVSPSTADSNEDTAKGRLGKAWKAQRQ